MTTQEQIYWWRYQELIQAARGDDASLFHAAQAKTRWQALTGKQAWPYDYLQWPFPRYERDMHMSSLPDTDPRKQKWLIEQKQREFDVTA